MYLHAYNMVHCNLKPRNILLDSKMNVKLTDLGLAKMIGNLYKEKA